MAILDSKLEMEKYYQNNSGVSGAATFSWDYPSEDTFWQYTPVSCYRDGIRNRNWKRDIARGRNATTPFVGVKQWYKSSAMYATGWGATVNPPSLASFRKRAARWNHGVNNVPSLPSGSLTVSADNAAATRFNKELEAALTLFQGGTALGELRETLRMIRNPAKSLRGKISDYLRSLKKRRKGSPSSKVKVLADTWLEHAFGWAPLLNDLDAAKDYLDNRANQLVTEFIPIQGSSTKSESLFGASSLNAGVLLLQSQYCQKGDAFVRYKGAVRSDAVSPKLINASSMGLHPRNFVPTAWELLPWSFAIDYFTNIGEVITGWSNQIADLAWGCKTIRRTSTISSNWSKSTLQVAYFVEHNSTNGTIDAGHKRIDRQSFNNSPIPQIQFEIPGFGTKWLNLAALVAGRRSMSPY